jgi:hypothetical protein
MTVPDGARAGIPEVVKFAAVCPESARDVYRILLIFELYPGAATILDVVMDDVFNELTFKVEYAATPGAPLLILETVRVDRARVFDVILEPVRVEYVPNWVVSVLTTMLDVVAVAVVCIVLPVSVETFNRIVLNAARLELRAVR